MMAPYVSIILIFLYAINVNSVLHHTYVNRLLQDQNTNELQSIVKEAKFNNLFLNYLQEIKKNNQHDDIYNPVARFLNNNYNNGHTVKDYEDIPYIRVSINDVDDGTKSDINVPSKKFQKPHVELPNYQPNDFPAANSGIHLLPNGNYQRVQIQNNNRPNVHSVHRQADTENLPYIVPPTNAYIPTASTHAVGTIKPDTDQAPNYAIVNINGQPTLVQMINLGALDLNNNAQAPTQQTPITTQGSNGQYILQKTNNVPLTNIDNITESFQKEEISANSNRDNGYNGPTNSNLNGSVFSMLNNPLYSIDPR